MLFCGELNHDWQRKVDGTASRKYAEIDCNGIVPLYSRGVRLAGWETRHRGSYRKNIFHFGVIRMAISTLVSVDDMKAYLGLTSPTAQQNIVVSMIVKGRMGLFVNYLGYNPIQSTYTEILPDTYNRVLRDPIIAPYESVGGGKIAPSRLYTQPNRVLQVANLPLRSVTSIYENPAAFDGGTAGGDWPEDTKLDPIEYYIDEKDPGFSETGFIVRNNSAWQLSPRTIKVTYVAGRTTEEIPEDMLYAFYVDCQISYHEAMMHFPKAQGGIGIMKSQRLETWGEEYDTKSATDLYGFKSTNITPRAKVILDKYRNFAAFI